LGASDIWQVILQVACFAKASLWSVWDINSIIIGRVVNKLIPSDLWSRWNVCGGIFLVTRSLIFLLAVEDLVFMRINISTSWVHWRSLVASLSSCWGLSWVCLDVLLTRDYPWRWQISISGLALIMVSLRYNLDTWFNRWLYSKVSLALKSWCWGLTVVFLA